MGNKNTLNEDGNPMPMRLPALCATLMLVSCALGDHSVDATDLPRTDDIAINDIDTPQAPHRECKNSVDCGRNGEALPPCVVHTCIAVTGLCALDQVVEGTPCDDGDLCTAADHCDAGLCTPGAPLHCDDANPCTDDLCDPSLGCVTSNNTAPCSDGLACTTGDLCDGGICRGGDGDCGCWTDEDCAAWEDEDLCDEEVYCDKSGWPPKCQVQPGTGVECTAAPDSCTSATCDPVTGGCVIAPLPDGAPCDDGDPCSHDDTCADKLCVSAQETCEDDNPCLTSVCHPKLGCVEEENGSCGECAGLSCLGCSYGVIGKDLTIRSIKNSFDFGELDLLIQELLLE